MNAVFSFNNFSFAFKDKILFYETSLSLKISEICLLSGNNGSGKTTLCRILSGLNTGYKGSVELYGKDLKGLSITDKANQIFFLKQEPRGNVILATPDEDLAVWQTRFQLKDNAIFKNTRLKALQSISMGKFAEAPLWELSNGQLKRVGLSALKLNWNKYWILDEPLTGLDQKLIDQVLALLKKHKEDGYGALIVSHRINHFKEIIDNHLIINDKKIMEQ